MDYKEKYLKYKEKYLKLKNVMVGGMEFAEILKIHEEEYKLIEFLKNEKDYQDISDFKTIVNNEIKSKNSVESLESSPEVNKLNEILLLLNDLILNYIKSKIKNINIKNRCENYTSFNEIYDRLLPDENTKVRFFDETPISIEENKFFNENRIYNYLNDNINKFVDIKFTQIINLRSDFNNVNCLIYKKHINEVVQIILSKTVTIGFDLEMYTNKNYIFKCELSNSQITKFMNKIYEYLEFYKNNCLLITNFDLYFQNFKTHVGKYMDNKYTDIEESDYPYIEESDYPELIKELKEELVEMNSNKANKDNKEKNLYNKKILDIWKTFYKEQIDRTMLFMESGPIINTHEPSGFEVNPVADIIKKKNRRKKKKGKKGELYFDDHEEKRDSDVDVHEETGEELVVDVNEETGEELVVDVPEEKGKELVVENPFSSEGKSAFDDPEAKQSELDIEDPFSSEGESAFDDSVTTPANKELNIDNSTAKQGELDIDYSVTTPVEFSFDDSAAKGEFSFYDSAAKPVKFDVDDPFSSEWESAFGYSKEKQKKFSFDDSDDFENPSLFLQALPSKATKISYSDSFKEYVRKFEKIDFTEHMELLEYINEIDTVYLQLTSESKIIVQQYYERYLLDIKSKFVKIITKASIDTKSIGIAVIESDVSLNDPTIHGAMVADSLKRNDFQSKYKICADTIRPTIAYGTLRNKINDIMTKLSQNPDDVDLNQELLDLYRCPVKFTNLDRPVMARAVSDSNNADYSFKSFKNYVYGDPEVSMYNFIGYLTDIIKRKGVGMKKELISRFNTSTFADDISIVEYFIFDKLNSLFYKNYRLVPPNYRDPGYYMILLIKIASKENLIVPICLSLHLDSHLHDSRFLTIHLGTNELTYPCVGDGEEAFKINRFLRYDGSLNTGIGENINFYNKDIKPGKIRLYLNSIKKNNRGADGKIYYNLFINKRGNDKLIDKFGEYTEENILYHFFSKFMKAFSDIDESLP